MLKHMFAKQNFKGFMADNTQANWNVSKLFMAMGTLLSKWLIKNALVYSIGLSHSISTPKN
jgi:hypothetical protein